MVPDVRITDLTQDRNMSDSSATEPTFTGEPGANDTADTIQSGLLAASTASGSYSGLDDTDSVDGQGADPIKTKALIAQLQAKIQRTVELIKNEQANKEASVNEYLRLSSNAEKQQTQRIKTVFEKKNQKSTQIIAQLQKKLENYKRRLKDVETHGASSSGHKQAKEVFRDMGQGLKNVGANFRDGISAVSGGVVDNIKGAKDTIVSKPKEFAHLIKNRFGSADNINSVRSQEESHGSTDEVEKPADGSHGNTLPAGFQFTPQGENIPGDNASDITSESVPSPGQSFQPHSHASNITQADLSKLIRDMQEDTKLRIQTENEGLKMSFHDELSFYKQVLEEERYRSERLEEQLNDLTELHQHEVTNIKQELSSMEEKMEYQLEERTRDMQDLLESCQTRITKMELQQQQQQLISMEGFENSNFRALITKLINVVLAILAVILVLVSTVANLLSPFLTTRLRILTTILLIACIVAVAQNWSWVISTSEYFVNKYRNLIPFG